MTIKELPRRHFHCFDEYPKEEFVEVEVLEEERTIYEYGSEYNYKEKHIYISKDILIDLVKDLLKEVVK